MTVDRSTSLRNSLRQIRIEKGYSQHDLAHRIGLTRQALYAIENNRYLPSTEIALKLAQALHCSVEDLFAIQSRRDVVEAELLGTIPGGHKNVRAKVIYVGDRILTLPMSALGDHQVYSMAADGLILGSMRTQRERQITEKVAVQLWQRETQLRDQIVVAGCDPAIFLVEAHLRSRFDHTTIVGRTMGSLAALQALGRGEVHIAGIHVVDPRTGEYNLPFVKKHMRGKACTVIRFAGWRQGLLVQKGNPKGIKAVQDLVKRGVQIVNRETGTGARLLLDQQLAKAGVPTQAVSGYDRVVSSQLEVGHAIAQGIADAGIGVEAAARYHDLDFIPLQEERYDFVIPTTYLTAHPRIPDLLHEISGKTLRTEIEVFGGYDTSETGKVVL